MTAGTRDLDQLAINTIRTLAMDAVQQANSGHPGTPMAMAPVVYTLWQRFLRFDPDDPIWPNRDLGTLAERVRHVVQAAFDGRRIVIFSGGAADTDETVFEQVRAIRDGGGFGSIIDRNSFQRKKPDALRFLKTIMDIYAGAAK